MDIKLIPESQVSNSEDFITFKIIMIGDSNSEKWAILKRAVKNSYDEGYQAKIGFEFLLMYFVVNDLKIKIQIYDTCGQEMYRSLIQGFYRNTSLALLVYDITSKSSFEGLDIWLEDVYSHDPEMPIFIIGNKDDLENERQISLEKQKNFHYLEKQNILLNVLPKLDIMLKIFFMKLQNTFIILINKMEKKTPPLLIL